MSCDGQVTVKCSGLPNGEIHFFAAHQASEVFSCVEEMFQRKIDQKTDASLATALRSTKFDFERFFDRLDEEDLGCPDAFIEVDFDQKTVSFQLSTLLSLADNYSIDTPTFFQNAIPFFEESFFEENYWESLSNKDDAEVQQHVAAWLAELTKDDSRHSSDFNVPFDAYLGLFNKTPKPLIFPYRDKPESHSSTEILLKSEQKSGGTLAKSDGQFEQASIITKRIARMFLNNKIDDLNQFTTIEMEAVKLLRKNNDNLCLNGLTDISAEVADELRKHKSSLSLAGLNHLSDAVVTSLCGFNGYELCLDGLSELNKETAAALAKTKARKLLLNGVKNITNDVADALSHSRAGIDLNGLLSLTNTGAKALAKRKHRAISLNGLTIITEDTAKALAKCEEKLFLNGLTELNERTAQALAKSKSCIELSGLTKLDDLAANAIGKKKGGFLKLTGLTKLSNAALESLSACEGLLILDGIAELSDAEASILGNRKGDLRLMGLKIISDQGLASLSKIEGKLALDALTCLRFHDVCRCL